MDYGRVRFLAQTARMVELGEPVWTEGLFGKRAAENDLGMEGVGGALLRRVLPGILDLTPCVPTAMWRSGI